MFKVNRKSIWKTLCILMVLVVPFIVAGCGNKNSKKNSNVPKENIKKIYYIDTNETKIVCQEYTTVSTTKEDLVKEYLEAISQEPKDITMKKALPENVHVEEISFNEDGRLTLNFNSDYKNLTGISEVLCRATIVKTLSQIEEVEYIEFNVNGQPLMGPNEKPIGFMESSDFIDNTRAENVFVTMYYANATGKALVSSNLKISYDGNRSIEQLIIQQLISGPEVIEGPLEKEMKKSIPDGTELLKVTTKDGICYVDFNDKFMSKISGVNDEVIIYSVVNSLVELSGINKVKFTINGEVKKNYGDGIPFEGLFERNLEIVEGSK
ncbi:GerMN domain-containing protein [Anaerocolumna sp.]|uniref:GerMN domain-containing protein n=1 Tax=Anaerocolumna sp. TaxID=2041569 RepID=UPI0028A7DE29|nr:GerMN domain-containing protein [Anaerocolumna sp.]